MSRRTISSIPSPSISAEAISSNVPEEITAPPTSGWKERLRSAVSTSASVGTSNVHEVGNQFPETKLVEAVELLSENRDCLPKSPSLVPPNLHSCSPSSPISI